ncbi:MULTISPECIES: aspartate/glutamate racemase family protein [Methylobacterium]|jgi:allantoin racemase|uniref:aspartate/glutamate racemase family protein n=1 Tax=Methylobacterium TaxID=407 RepID=UPI0003488C96|nr:MULTISPECIES: aspartate/glutamate racemase family protein [Methylobacterium]KQS79681.1 Asp/Glu racemase [Methylobacterium sp. Leaf361]MBN4098491.1 aspartate/glutamate racemase family protein [Methylobacterium sp. OT2]UIN37886.1 aspartate/glutamate racemase family protein [Methylobacterium oryzae]SEG01999.1 Asp/Glu/hydantoin racemase [Methylobacterium sp. 190mf]SFT24981.1 Asp/Glu/hydantoin racemase [Methylobacterium sp. yr668]
MRILLLNPNTSTSVTDLLAGQVGTMAGATATFVPATARFGAAYIASRAALAIAGHAALDAFAEHGRDCDAVFLACFGDPGLLALREVSPVPVVGMLEASCREAQRVAGRYAIVTGGALWKPMLRECVASLGVGDGLAGIRTIARTGGEIAKDPEAALSDLAAACRACAEEDRAEAVILGGAALVGLAARLQPHVPVPVLCSVTSGVKAVVAAAAAPYRRPPAVAADNVGLGHALATLLAPREAIG